MNLIYTPKPYFPKIHFNFVLHPCLGLQSGIFPSGCATKILYVFLISPMHATCPSHLVLLDLITLIIFGEDYNYGAPHYAVFLRPLSLPPS
jgi:hypothetical protein